MVPENIPSGPIKPAAPKQVAFQLQVSPADGPLPILHVHRFAVVPTYGEKWPVSILLVQMTPFGLPTSVFCLQAERDLVKALVDNLGSGTFIETARRASAQGVDPARICLEGADLAAVKALRSDRWFFSHLLAVRAATSLTGVELEWVEGSAWQIKTHLDEVEQHPETAKPLAAKPSISTRMTSAVVVGLYDACKATLKSLGAPSGDSQ